MTGFKPSRNDLCSNTCSSALATALITLTGHVKQVSKNFCCCIEVLDSLAVHSDIERKARDHQPQRSTFRGDKDSIEFPAENRATDDNATDDDANDLSAGQ
jgi:hypothetical protein